MKKFNLITVSKKSKKSGDSLNGKNAFEFFLDKLEILMRNASADENPGWWLYQNDARTPLFMIEALCRIFEKVLAKRMFSKWRKKFKMLEDFIGQVDHFDAMARESKGSEGEELHAKAYLAEKTLVNTAYLNEILHREGWLGAKSKKIEKFRKKLRKVKWLKPKKETEGILNFFEIEIEEIKSFYEKYKYGFTELEDQVHEFRRDLRWLSIYAHALRGQVQLINSGIEHTPMDEFVTEAILTSPYNQLPDATGHEYIILFDRTIFLALSAMLDQLGTIKDEGLRILLQAEAIQQDKQVNSNLSLLAAFQTLGYEADGLQKILLRATNISSIFFKEALLDRLLQGIATVTENS